MSYERPVIQNCGTVRSFLKLFSAKRTHSSLSEDPRVQKLKNLIDNDPLRARWNLDQVCKQLELGMSVRQTRRLFKAATGMGIKEYAKKMRLEAAAHQLRATDLPIKAIAGEAGYRHVSTFTRHFLKQFHLCPLDFRKIGRGGYVAA